MRFSDVLKQLLKTSNTKMKDLAEYLSYDLSYISKWANDKILPNNKVYIRIIERMSEYFSNKIYLSGQQERVVEMSERKFLIETRVQLKNLIFSLLEYGYFLSDSSTKENSVNAHEERTYVNMDKESIIDNIAEEIKKAVYSSSEDLEIYCSSGDLYFMRELLSKFKSFFVINNIRVVMKLMITDDNVKTIFQNREIRDEIYRLASNLIFFDIEVYEDFSNSNSGFVYIKEKFIINYTTDINGFPNTLLYSEIKSILEQHLQVCKNLFSQKTLTMKSEDKLGFEDRLLEFYMSPGHKKIIIYSAYLEGFYITKEFLEKLIAKHKIKGFEAQMLRTMQRSYAGIIKDRDVVLNMSKRGLASSISKRELVVADMVFKLTEEEFNEYMDGFKELLNSDDRVNVNIFEDRNFPFHIYELGMSVFVSEDYVYFKKNPIYVDEKINGYFEFMEKSYSQNFFRLADEFQEEGHFVSFSEEDLDEYLKLMTQE